MSLSTRIPRPLAPPRSDLDCCTPHQLWSAAIWAASRGSKGSQRNWGGTPAHSSASPPSMLTKWPTRGWQTARGAGIEVPSPVALSAAGRSTASTILARVSHAPQPMLAFQRRSEDAAASPPTVVSRTLDVAHQARSPPWAMACDGSTLRSGGDHSRAAPRPRCLLEAHISTLEDRAGPCRPICALSFAAR